MQVIAPQSSAPCALAGNRRKTSVKIRDSNPNPTNFLDPERIRNLNYGLLIFTTFVAFKTNLNFTVS